MGVIKAKSHGLSRFRKHSWCSAEFSGEQCPTVTMVTFSRVQVAGAGLRAGCELGVQVDEGFFCSQDLGECIFF